MAPSVVPGDPGEYQLIAARWGIGHPPGYGFYALLGNLFTRAVPVGTLAWRANLLSAVCGAATVALAYGIGQTLSGRGDARAVSLRGQVPSILGALVLAAGLDLWQHAIHANAHIVTALLATLSLFLLLCWWREKRDLWLLLCCLVAGMSPVHHPLLVFAFPGYVAFVLVVRPRILKDGRTLLKMIGFALLGLTAYLYYPIRSAIGAPPLPGPEDMHTWSGFVRMVTAQGLRGNLLGFSTREILRRLWDVRVPLGLQYTAPTLLLASVGAVSLWMRRWRPALLLTAYLAGIVLATVNILQDAMAYLLGPVMVVGVLAGLGARVLIERLGQWADRRWAFVGIFLLLGVLPLWSATANWVRTDLHDFYGADEWLAGIEDRFEGRGEGAVLLTEWERMTTVYYYAAVEGRVWDEGDVRLVPVSSGTEAPFLEAAEAYLPRGPVYVTSYRPKVAQRYRLLPSGDLWRVVPSWPHSLPAEAHAVNIVAEGRFEIVGWRLDRDEAQRGDVLLLDLYMRLPDPEGVEAQQYYLPWAKLGETTYHFTTDSRFSTPWWQAGEIVVERFELPVAWKGEAGRTPLQVGVQWVNEGRDLTLADGGTLATLTEVVLSPGRWRTPERKLDSALGNLHGEILLSGARINGQAVPGLRGEAGEQRLTIRPGRTLRVALAWESLRPVEENYTVFVQLLDTALRVRAQSDSTPLGGSSPTLLWFPRWRQGTRIVDTHWLDDVPPDLAPGPYPLVVGMYGFSTHKRVQVVSPSGDVAGDWVTLDHLWVE